MSSFHSVNHSIFTHDNYNSNVQKTVKMGVTSSRPTLTVFTSGVDTCGPRGRSHCTPCEMTMTRFFFFLTSLSILHAMPVARLMTYSS